MAAKTPTITRVRVAREELEKMSKEQLQKCWNLQDQYIDLLENKLQSGSEHSELMSLRESEEKLKQQQLDASRRENILVMRLTTKEHEMQEFAGQIQELKQAQVPTIAQLRSAMLDPAVNLLFERMRKEVEALKARLEETQNELSAWKFTPDSNTGKRLMAKCRLLYQENEELGKIISSGRMAKLEGDLALQKSFSEEMKKSQSELDEFLLELDEDVEGMQSTIYYLQQQLREAKEQINQLQREKHVHSGTTNGLPEKHLTNNVDDCKLSKLQTIVENHEEDNTSLDSLSNEVNRTEYTSSPVKKELNCEESMDIEPTKDCNDTESVENKTTVTEPAPNVPAQKLASKDLPVTPQETIVQSIVVENKNSINHEKLSPLVERTNLPVENLDSSENVQKRTNDQKSDLSKSTEKDVEVPPKDTPVQNATQKPNKKASEGAGRGRKRTRPRTPVESDSIKEDSLPVRKRTRRREAEPRQDTIEENRTSVEIDTDTEVQVAQTLASWASTKQERTEIKSEVDDTTLGNGEIKTDSEEK
ncbi:pre-mRNA-splicing regulator WTAP [Trichonephila inaurata madagascariensis]|uniref:Pre-mRNA-splicing regulator WTAP n=2 Tax=Nephilidae TaxID=450948 RepID=A0A8X6XRP8_9ARAC|nr:pre-mRNA-splicing regulator WTAP [Trichonephila inaurata madagascariensis]